MSVYRNVTSLVRPFIYFFYRIKTEGDINLPSNGAYIVASNHINNLDPLVLSCVLRNREIHFLAKKELFANRFLSKFFTAGGVIPIDRNKSDITAIKKVLKLLKSQHVLGIFPQGTRKKENEEDTSKAGIGMFVSKSKAPIIPVTIKSNYRLFSEIHITVHEPYVVEDELLENPSMDNYIEISNRVMNRIKSAEIL